MCGQDTAVEFVVALVPSIATNVPEWKVGDATEFLVLLEQEATLVELRLALSRSVRARRLKLGLSQVELASRLGSSQSRVAKLEGADATVSIDLLIRGLLALAASRREIGRALAE